MPSHCHCSMADHFSGLYILCPLHKICPQNSTLHINRCIFNFFTASLYFQRKHLVQLSIMLFVYRFIHLLCVSIRGCALQNIIDVGLQLNGDQAVGQHSLTLGGGRLQTHWEYLPFQILAGRCQMPTVWLQWHPMEAIFQCKNAP